MIQFVAIPLAMLWYIALPLALLYGQYWSMKNILLNEDTSLWVRIPQTLGWDLLTFLLAALWLHTFPREDR
jgi:hypothetical protein